jgi:hypothetical protein
MTDGENAVNSEASALFIDVIGRCCRSPALCLWATTSFCQVWTSIRVCAGKQQVLIHAPQVSPILRSPDVPDHEFTDDEVNKRNKKSRACRTT